MVAKPDLVLECELVLKQRLLCGFGVVLQQMEVLAMVIASQPLVGPSQMLEPALVLQEDNTHMDGPCVRVLLFSEAPV